MSRRPIRGSFGLGVDPVRSSSGEGARAGGIYSPGPMRAWLSPSLLAALASCAAPVASPPPSPAAAPDARTVATTYRSMRAMTAEPVRVDAGLAMLCRGMTPADVRKVRTAHGPHALTEVRIFMNDAAAVAFAAPGAKYPVGSVVVKEKTALRCGQEGGHDGVGAMIKRTPGYDPAHGDWEYLYFEDVASIESGRLASCIDCHSGAASADYVFGHWADGSCAK